MIYRFLNFELDADLKELRRAGETCAIEPQVFDLLLFLVENRDRLISHDELIENVWRGRIVADATIASRIRTVRKVLGDTGTDQKIIQTQSKRGFRFVAALSVEARKPADAANDDGNADLNHSIADDKPSIAVLPFDNLSNDPEQEYFSDGITEDIITALSQFHQFFVIARNSSFTFKGQAVDVKQVATELGVQYVIEGSVRRAGSRVRISAQLIDAATSNHIWAERYDRELDDIFAVQDEITERIAMAVGPELDATEMARARRKGLRELGLWEMIARANWHVSKYNEVDNTQAHDLLQRGLKTEPDNARIHAMLAACFNFDALYGWRRPLGDSREMALQMGQKAVDLDRQDEHAHAQLGFCLLAAKRHGEAERRLATAIKLNPNYSAAIGTLGVVKVYTHRFDDGLELLQKAMHLSPKDPLIPLYLVLNGGSEFIKGRYDEALAWAERALDENPNFPTVHRFLAAVHGMRGDLQAAQSAYEQFDGLAPGSTIAACVEAVPFAYEDDSIRFAEGLRRAGMPEE